MNNFDDLLKPAYHVSVQLQRMFEALNSVVVCAEQEMMSHLRGSRSSPWSTAQLSDLISAYEQLAAGIGSFCADFAARGHSELAEITRRMNVANVDMGPEQRALLDDFEIVFSSAESVVASSRANLTVAVANLQASLRGRNGSGPST